MLITDNRKIIAKLAEQMLASPSDLVSVDMTDFKEIDDSELKKLYGVKVLVINALRYQPHDSHLSVAEALAIIEKVAPERAYLTHMSHEIGLHALAEQRLPKNVYFAYDKLKIEL
jgi:phosphoribosyl 1,2-cyclic phosphate phosphodiesterase